MNRLQQLQQQIADDGARENIESFCFLETIEDGHHWYSECPDDPENEIVAPSVEYLTLRGLIVRHPHNHWVRVDVAPPVEPAMDEQDAVMVVDVEPVMVAGLPVSAVLELAIHYAETGSKSTILADQIRRIAPPIIAAIKQSLAQPQAPSYLDDESIIAVGREYFRKGANETPETLKAFCNAVRHCARLAKPVQPQAPIDIILHCPACGMQHVDAPDERTLDWNNEPHRSHLCHGCGHIWRPADVATNGVASIKTAGKNDSAKVQPQSPVAPNCFITTVPDHHDRIVWRNTYYHLPLDKAPVVPEGSCAADGAWYCQHPKCICRAVLEPSQRDERALAMQEYSTTAFDYPNAPIGSRDWCLYWDGWKACAASKGKS